jgi:hypothetical protein
LVNVANHAVHTDNRIRVREQLRLFTSFEPTAVLHRTGVEQLTSCRNVDDQERRATFAIDGALIDNAQIRKAVLCNRVSPLFW